MTTILSSVEQIVAAVRANERKQLYRLVRADVWTVPDAVPWLRTWREGDSLVWFDPNDGQDAEDRRARTIRYWFWLRWLHADEQVARGGV